MKWLWEHIKIMFAGLVMVTSDAIPGFSGGIGLTITGRLHEVWGTWNKIKSPKKKGDRIAGILYYVFFLSGSVAGTFGFAQIIKLMLDNIPAITFWFFISLSIGSIFIYRKVNSKDLFKFKGAHAKSRKSAAIWFFLGLATIAILALVTFLTSGRQDVHSLRNANGTVGFGHTKETVMVLLGGFFASAAMVTPGMSGAIILLVFGAYGNLYSGLYSHPGDHPWVLLMYVFSSAFGTVISVVVLDKVYKKWPFSISWFFYGTIAFSIAAMAWIFDVFIPADSIRWAYIATAVCVGGALATATYKFVEPHD